MNEFKDRKAEHINRKKLNVVEVIRDDGGEIIDLVVDVSRMEGMVTQEGTPLNAESLNTIISNIVKEEVGQILNDILTSEKKLELDVAKLEVEEYMCSNSNLILLSEGVLGTTFNWSVEGSGITFENNVLSVSETEDDHFVKLILHAVNKNETQNKEFIIKILGTNNIERRTISVYPDGSGVANAVFDVEANSEAFIENDYSFLVGTRLSEDNKLTVTILAEEYLEGGVMEVSFKVIVKDKTTSEVTKEITITVEFLESLEGED